jgi:predicted transcriptional regulator
MTIKKRKPTVAELKILRVLWEKGSCTVRDVHETIGVPKGTSYTTTLKLMQIMDEKGLVKRDKSRRPHIYETVHNEDQTQRTLVSDLVERAFGGSASKLVMQALSTSRASKKELDAIRKVLNELEKKS